MTDVLYMTCPAVALYIYAIIISCLIYIAHTHAYSYDNVMVMLSLSHSHSLPSYFHSLLHHSLIFAGQILNQSLKEQYNQFLQLLMCR